MRCGLVVGVHMSYLSWANEWIRTWPARASPRRRPAQFTCLYASAQLASPGRTPRCSCLPAARASMPPTALLAPSHHRLAARAYCSSPLAPTPRRRPRCSPLSAVARRSRRSRELSIRYENDSERATGSGYRYPPHLAGWTQPTFSGIFRGIWLPLSIVVPKLNTG
jgi:hypothetical protein